MAKKQKNEVTPAVEVTETEVLTLEAVESTTEIETPAVEVIETPAGWEQKLETEIDTEVAVTTNDGINGTLVIDAGLIEVKPEYFPEYTITKEGGLVFFDLK